MMKVINFVTMCAVLAGAAMADSFSAGEDPVGYTIPSEVQAMPVNAPTTYTTCPNEQAFDRYGWAVYGAYGINTQEDNEYDVDMGMLEAEMAYYITKHQALTFGLGIHFGSGDAEEWIPTPRGAELFPYDFSRSGINLMVGYRASIPLTSRVSLVFGAKAGLDVQELGLDYDPDEDECCHHCYDDDDDDCYHDEYEQSDTKIGFAYAGFAGLNIAVSEKLQLELGYQYWASTAQPEITKEWLPEQPKVECNSMGLHEIRVGLRGTF